MQLRCSRELKECVVGLEDAVVALRRNGVKDIPPNVTDVIRKYERGDKTKRI
jgi:uncharacterized protein Yka (UPF0111/DUF47 family)